MTMILEVTGAMTDEQIRGAMPYEDFASNAIASVTRDPQLADEVFCSLHRIDDLHVLFFEASGTAMVNQISTGTGDSTYIENVSSARDAADEFRKL